MPEGHRFEATQALREVLNHAVASEISDSNPAKAGVDNPRRQHPEKRPSESWTEIDAVAEHLGSVYGPMIVVGAAAATGLRPGEWIALEQRDLDRDARVVYVHRAFAHGRLKNTKTRRVCEAYRGRRSRSTRSDRLPARPETPLLFPRRAVAITGAAWTFGGRRHEQLRPHAEGSARWRWVLLPGLALRSQVSSSPPAGLPRSGSSS
jgi:integrase